MKTQNTKITKNIVLALLAISSVNAAVSHRTDGNVRPVMQPNVTYIEESNKVAKVALNDLLKSIEDLKKTNHGFVSKEIVVNTFNELVGKLADNKQMTLDAFFFGNVSIKKEGSELKVKAEKDTAYKAFSGSVEEYLSENAKIFYSIVDLLSVIECNGYNNEQCFKDRIKVINEFKSSLFDGNLYIESENKEENQKNRKTNKENREEKIKRLHDIINIAKKDGVLTTTASFSNYPIYSFNQKNAIIVSSIVVILLALAAFAYYYYV